MNLRIVFAAEFGTIKPVRVYDESLISKCEGTFEIYMQEVRAQYREPIRVINVMVPTQAIADRFKEPAIIGEVQDAQGTTTEES